MDNIKYRIYSLNVIKRGDYMYLNILRRINIFDNYGRLILSTLNDKSLIDMSGFESGIYLLDFKLYDNSHIMKKVAKK